MDIKSEIRNASECNASKNGAQAKGEPSSSKHHIYEDLERAFTDKVFADVDFVLSSGPDNKPNIISAHKCILAARSEVFHKMFLAKSASIDKLVINAANDDPVAFSQMIQYLYRDECVLTAGTIFLVLGIADKYRVHGLKDKCNEFLANAVSPENVFLTLNQARLSNAKELLDRCEEVIKGLDIVMERDCRIGNVTAPCQGPKHSKDRTALLKTTARRYRKKIQSKKKNIANIQEKKKRRKVTNKLKRERWIQILRNVLRNSRTSDIHRAMLEKCVWGQRGWTVPMKLKMKFQNYMMCCHGFRTKNHRIAAGELFDILKSVERSVPLFAVKREIL